jgi:hypothetical protein
VRLQPLGHLSGAIKEEKNYLAKLTLEELIHAAEVAAKPQPSLIHSMGGKRYAQMGDRKIELDLFFRGADGEA